MHVSSRVVVLAALLAVASCTTYRDQLSRGQRAFELNEHDRTLAILRDLEPDVKRLTLPEQAQYAYLRGMTDYRIGYKADARHWLAIAKAHEDHSPGLLPADWKARTNEALEELNGVVYSAGASALTTARTDGDGPSSPEPRGRSAPSEPKSDGDKASSPSEEDPKSEPAPQAVPSTS
jgi:hypothetical protein